MRDHNSTIQLLAKLVSFQSVSGRTNLPILEFIENYLNDLGAETYRTYNETGDRANLLARIVPASGGSTWSGDSTGSGGSTESDRSTGSGGSTGSDRSTGSSVAPDSSSAANARSPSSRETNVASGAVSRDANRPGVILSGHTDVVPVTGQTWQTDPWTVEEREGRLYGRGTCDMKGFDAALLSWVARLDRSALTRPVYLAFSYDEELGLVGVPRLIEQFKDLGFQAELCIVGEPTSMQVGTAHKAVLRGKCTVTGVEAHSSLAPDYPSAIYGAARLVARLSEMADTRAANGPFARQYDIPHSSIHVGLISGGNAVNIVPRHCQFDFEFRTVPGERPQDLLDEITGYAGREVEPYLQTKNAEASVRFETVVESPELAWQEDSELPAELALKLAREAVTDTSGTPQVQSTDPPATPITLPYSTEAGLFQLAGIPTVVCGPGSIDQAHKPDEFITLHQLAAADRFLDGLESVLRHSDVEAPPNG